jgi:ankyrin repeat protein
MMAARSGNLEIVQLLLDGGADPGVTNHKGQTALDLAKGHQVEGLLRSSPNE